MTFGIDGDELYLDRAAAAARRAASLRHQRRIVEAVERIAWIRRVKDKLRTALAYAAEGKPFEWDQLGPDRWPTAPVALINPWPNTTVDLTPMRPGYPPLPDPATATFEDFKRYAAIQYYAEVSRAFWVQHMSPLFRQPTDAELWELGEAGYDGRYLR